MRIVAGSLKGRKIASPDWPGLRPTSERLRETIFDIFADCVGGARVLDTFAGTGAVGFEALSRGAEHVVFVDNDERAISLMTETSEQFAVTNECEVILGKLPEFDLAGSISGVFDFIFCDPPYAYKRIDKVLDRIKTRLAFNGVIVLERSKRVSEIDVTNLDLYRTIRAGDSRLDMYR